MPRISETKKQKISEQILAYLFSTSPNAKYTVEIAKETARDEEFIKKLLYDLHEKKLIVPIKKSATGKDYIKRERWRLSNTAFEVYRQAQSHHTYIG